jgi:hypothetical protein
MADAEDTPGFELGFINTAENHSSLIRGRMAGMVDVIVGPMRLRAEVGLNGDVGISHALHDRALYARISIAARQAVIKQLTRNWAGLNEYDRTKAKLPAVNFTSEHPQDLQQEVADLHQIVRLLNERLAKLERG